MRLLIRSLLEIVAHETVAHPSPAVAISNRQRYRQFRLRQVPLLITQELNEGDNDWSRVSHHIASE